ncbi:MAG: enhanced serine sensitivity protein SseB [Coprococcus sp.]
MDVAGLIRNDELVKAIAAIKANSNTDTQREYLSNVVKSTYLIPAIFDKKPQKANEGKIAPDEKVKVNFCVITGKDKRNFFPIFTDVDEYNKGSYEGADKMLITYRELVPMVLKSNGAISGLAINPHGNGIIMLAGLMEELEKNKIRNVKRQTIAPNEKIKLRTPKYMPVDMLEEAKKFFAGKPYVERAYIQLMETPDSDEQYLIAVETEGDEAALFSELMPLIKPLSFGIKTALTNTRNGLGAKVAEIAEPFYQKESQE